VKHLINGGRLCRSIALFLLALLPSCLDGGDPVGQSSGSVGSGSTSEGFEQVELEGSWVGLLSPYDTTQPERSTYFKFDSIGRLIESADTDANEWYLETSYFSAQLLDDGTFASSMMASYGTRMAQVFTGTMDASRNVLEGSYELSKDGFSVQEGTFALTRSLPGNFNTSVHLAGAWVGPAFNEVRKGVSLSVALDESGSPLSGGITDGPEANWEPIHDFLIDGSNTQAFQFADDAVGRLENVQLLSDDGAVTTFRFLIVSPDGLILGGPGEDSELGHGKVRLARDNQQP
jgi:hypothetical protein